MFRILIAVLLFALGSATVAAQTTDEEYLRALAGRYPWQGAAQGDLSFFEVPSIAASLKKILSPTVLKTITRELATGTPNKIVAGFLLVSACKPHNCPAKSYIALANPRNASVVVVLYDSAAGVDDRNRTRCFSETGDLRMLPDAVVEQVLERFVSRTREGQRLYEANRWIDELKCGNGNAGSGQGK